jgi:hypothetical protein
MNNPIFNKIVLFDRIKPDRENNLKFINPTDFAKTLKLFTEPCEYISLNQTKPFFDVEIYNLKSYVFDEISTVSNIKIKIEQILGLKNCRDIYIIKREPREELYNSKPCIKYSYHFIVDKIRLNYETLRKLIIDKGYKDNQPFDISVYKKNSGLYPIFSNKKADKTGSGTITVPQLLPFNLYSGLINEVEAISKYCPSYIEEDFEDYDIKFGINIKPKTVSEKKVIEEEDNDDDNDESENKYDKLNRYINHLSPNRSDNFDGWSNMFWCIVNICNKEKISRRKGSELIHTFSKLSKTNYNEDKVDDWIDKNYDKVRETGYGWTYLIHTCIKEDDKTFYETLQKSYPIMKKDFEKFNAKILYPPMIVHIDNRGENFIQTIKQCESTNRHLKTVIIDTNKKGEKVFKYVSFIKNWLDDPKIKKYDNYVFKPKPLKVEDYEYNTWTDFEILKTPYEEDDTVVARILEFMTNLLNNVEVVNFILAQYAYRIQNPAYRTKVLTILYGEEGDGKNRLFDILKNIVGDKFFTEIDKADKLFGTHSCLEQEKLFICLNEAKCKDNYENSEVLKARITTNKLIVNPKGIQEFSIDNYCDYFMTTNNPNAVKIHDKSRRYLYVETTSYYSRNDIFFNSFSDEIVDNKRSLRTFYEYLMKFDVSKVIPSGNFQNHIPITEIQKDIIIENRDKILYFLESYISQSQFEFNNDEVKIKNSILFKEWNEWIKENNIDIKYNSISFGSRLGHLMKKVNAKYEIIKRDTNSNTYINLELLRNYFIDLNSR